MKVFSNGIFYFSGRAIVACASLAIVPVMARILSPDDFNSFVISWSFCLSLVGVTAGTVNQAQLRFSENIDDACFKVAFYIVAIVSIAIGVLASLLFEYVVLGEIGTTAFFCIGLTLYLISLAGMQARQLGMSVLKFEISRAIVIVASLSTVALLGLSSSHEPAILTFGFGYVLLACFSWIARGGKNFGIWSMQHLTNVDTKAEILKICTFGIPIGVWIFMSNFLQVLDKVVVTRFFDANVAAQYSATAEVVYRGSMLFFLPIVVAAHPELIRRFCNNLVHEASFLQRRIYAVFLLTSVFGVIFVATLGLPLIEVVINAPVTNTGDTMQAPILFILGAGMWSSALVAHKWLEATSNTMVMLKLMTIAVLVHFVCIAVGLKAGNLNIIAGSYLISSSVYIFLVYVVSSRLRRRCVKFE